MSSVPPSDGLPPGSPVHASRLRYRAYLERRRKMLKEDPAAVARGAVSDEQASRRKRKRSFWLLFREFWRLLRGRRHIILLSVATLTASTLLGLIPPATTKITLDFILTDNPGPQGLRAWLHLPDWIPLTTDRRLLLWIVGAVLLVLTCISISLHMWGRSNMTRLTKRLQAMVRRRVFDHAVRLPLHRVQQIKSGGVASILREDAGGAAELLFSLLYNPWRAIVQLAGTLVILAVVDWRLLLGSLAIIPAAYLSQKTWISRIRPIFTDIRHTRTSVDAHATEAFGGMRVVRGFGRQRGEVGRFTRGNHLMARQEMLAWWWSRIIEIVWQVLLPVASIAVLLYGGNMVIDGRLTVGDVMMFSFYLMMLLGPLESLTNSATAIQNQLAGFDRVLDLLAEPLELGRSMPAPAARVGADRAARDGVLDAALSSRGRIVTPASTSGRISLANVCFSYPGHTQRVLQDITLDVEPGQTVALVGRSGAGKTTLCNLVARFYDPTEGAIFLDGADLRQLDIDSYRRLLGIVEQDVFLFDGTVAENIGYGRRGASMERIRAAAEAANADGFIRAMEKGYATVIGERGVRLSGGQKQRIAIARALLADPRILILDEATSNLDSESELLIQESLAELMRGRTCFVIAHRLSTIRHADLIVVLESGRVIETGTHDELLTRAGRYAEMLRIQLRQPEPGLPAPTEQPA
jgi:ATP-binding cassette subfamily B protein/subfamily B ATP-binding cassette protein MsbA